MLPLTAPALRFYSGKSFAAWVTPEGIVSAFYDGSTTLGVPPAEDYFAMSADFLGYGDDIYWHMVEHDLCHHMVAEKIGKKRSGAIWAAAHNPGHDFMGVMPPAGLLEEQRLVAVQRMLNNRPPAVEEWGKLGYADLMRFCSPWGLADWVDNLRFALRREGAMTSAWAGRR